jgi:hypothetical protein
MYAMFAMVAWGAFWGGVIWLWMLDGPKIPLVFIALWLLGWFAFPRLHWAGPAFLAFDCVLAVLLLLIGKFKSMM